MKLKRCISRPIRFYLQAFFTASALLGSPAVQSQSATSQSETPMGVTANGIQGNWLSYHGDSSGHRYSELKEITPDNIARLQLKWVFHSRKARVLGATPVVINGVMYLTASNDLFAIDGLTGVVLWHHTRQDAAGASDDESAHINRGIAVLNNSVFMETDDAHLLALDARSGNILWDVPYADGDTGSSGVSTPLVVRDQVIVGASGGSRGGFLAAFDAATGKEIWRFGPRTASSQTEAPNSPIESHAYRAESWMPGTYDAELGTIFWITGGQPCSSAPSAKPEDAQHDSCLLALDSTTGKLKWQSPLNHHAFFSPAVSGVPVLADTVYLGVQRKLILVAESNGSLRISDRKTGTLLDVKNSDSIKFSDKACAKDPLSPSWTPPSYSEQARIFYFMSVQQCHAGPAIPDVARQPAAAKVKPKSTGNSTLLAYDLGRDSFLWKNDSAVSEHAPTGVMATASGLLLLGGKTQSFQAVDAKTGKLLWSFPMGQSATGSPMSFAIEDHQYFAVAAGNDLFVFGLP